ncbi:MAG: DNA polymerase III subunit beta [Alphaproteobacteria bacterium]|nr:DNA polymerase III subunit beta [Alphaproteobacteria bacterium]
MKLTIERTALLRSLEHVQSVVERRNTIPILSNVRIGAENGQIALTATDLDLAVVASIACDVQAKGATTAPAHTLYDIVRKLPEGAQVELAVGKGEGRLALRSGRSEFSLACLPVEDFPVMAEGELPHRFRLPAADLRKLIDGARFAISTEETRYYLNGIFLHVANEGGERLRAVATDGHRLAQVDVAMPAGASGMPGVIVPRKVIGELRKLLGEDEATVEVALSTTKIRFEVGEAVLTSKLIDGTFPDYQRVIPRQNDKRLAIEPKILAAAVDRVSTINSLDKLRAVKLALDKDRLTVSASSAEQGSASEEIAAAYRGGALAIGFNSRYLLDILAQVTGAEAQFEFADSTSPVVVRDGEDKAALYVLMPMRV